LISQFIEHIRTSIDDQVLRRWQRLERPTPWGLVRMSKAIAGQLEAARQVHRKPSRPLRDGRGRRLRASAHSRHSGANRRGGDLSAVIGLLPTEVKAGALLLFALSGFLGTSQLFVDYAAELPDAHALTSSPLPEDTMIYAADGSLLADLRQPGTGLQHYYQPLDQMGTLLPEAVVAVEDTNFWHEPGIDPQGIARAAWTDWREHRTVQGASTITQQLVKIRLLKDPSQTVDRKIKEAILAIQVDRTYSKRQILEMYLNSVDFANNARGPKAAAQNYFRKNTKDLDLAQAAMLAGIPQSPPNNSPLLNPQGAKARQKQVLDAMVRDHMISRQQADAARAEPLDVNRPEDSIKGAPAFVSWVVEELQGKYGYTTAYEGGLQVRTTLDPTLQKIAEDSVVNNILNANRGYGHHIEQGAMVSIDPRTGEVLTMVGSAFRNQDAGQYNWAADIPLNPGSTMKLFTYTAAIESRKYTMVTPVPNVPITINMPGQDPHYQPTNYDTRSYLRCVVRTCMGNSLNIPAVVVEITTGVPQVVDMARRLGAPPWGIDPSTGTPTRDAPATSFGASMTLGSAGETPVQMATAAATIADMGVYHPSTGIARVTSSDGTEIFRYDPAVVAKRVLEPQVAYIMQTIMSDNNNRAAVFTTTSPLVLPDRRVAAKTGTYDQWLTAWTLGYTPSLASAFYFGNPDNTSIGPGFDAVFAAAPAWHAFMESALNARHAPATEWSNLPPGLVPGPGDQVWLLPGTNPNQPTPPLPPWASIGGYSPYRPPKN
jgi:membrane peptidoglycan carboxypeptidase